MGCKQQQKLLVLFSRKETEEEADPANPPTQPTEALYPLRVLLMSLKRVPDECEDESIRRHMMARFSHALPVHRIAVFVAC